MIQAAPTLCMMCPDRRQHRQSRDCETLAGAEVARELVLPAGFRWRSSTVCS